MDRSRSSSPEATPYVESVSTRAMDQRLEQLYDLGILRVRLEVGDDGLPTFASMPDRALSFSGGLLVTLQRLFTERVQDLATEVFTAYLDAKVLVSQDIKHMNKFLAMSTTSATAQELADGEDTLATYPQVMARTIRYGGNISIGNAEWWFNVAHDVERHNEHMFPIINDFVQEMSKAKDQEQPRCYAWGNVGCAAEHMEKFLGLQMNRDMLITMAQAMTHFSW
ncbi:hypothetical protein F52700_7984 [Fusarium sp. NRRL 52700]|nr:hypothetical protein F52700_7984 [Fusarium sp. NRRL 52700]